MIREKNGFIYIFAVRVTEQDPIIGSLYLGVEPTSISTTFTLSNPPSATTAEVVDESRSVTIVSGAFTDTFARNAVHIYKISAADTTAPTVPTNLAGIAASATQINLSWTASTDNVGVTGYGVYRNGTLASSTANTACSDSGLTAATTYAYSVNAYDAAGNISAKTSAINVATLTSSSSSSSGSSSGTSSSTSASPPSALRCTSMTWNTGARLRLRSGLMRSTSTSKGNPW